MPKNRTEKEYADLGKAVTTLFETGAISKKELYKASFLRGVLSGVGGVIGATVVIAILIWTLSFFSDIPFVGRFADRIQTTIDSRPE